MQSSFNLEFVGKAGFFYVRREQKLEFRKAHSRGKTRKISTQRGVLLII